MNRLLNCFFILLFFITLVSCNKKGYGDLSPYADDGILQTIVSIEAGTSIPFVYDKEQKGFKSYKKDGQTQLIQFLPPPFNLGIIPSSDENSEFLKTLIITQGYKIGTRIKFLPICSISYTRSGKENTLIVGKPYAETARVIDVDNLVQLQTQQPDIVTIINLWLKNNDYNDLKWNDIDVTNELLKRRLSQ